MGAGQFHCCPGEREPFRADVSCIFVLKFLQLQCTKVVSLSPQPPNVEVNMTAKPTAADNTTATTPSGETATAHSMQTGQAAPANDAVTAALKAMDEQSVGGIRCCTPLLRATTCLYLDCVSRYSSNNGKAWWTPSTRFKDRPKQTLSQWSPPTR